MKQKYYLDNFTKVLEDNIDSDNLTNFHNNLKTLDYRVRKINPHFSFREVISGTYDSRKNRINIYDDDESIIYHELLHMASSKYVDDKAYEGFYSDYYGEDHIMVGTGINEGYTELLTRKLFNIEDSRVCNGYEYLVYIATLLEQIIGEELMQRYYFNANLPAVIEELSNYSNYDDAINFIDDCDYILKSLDKTIIYFRKNNVFAKLVEINKFLATSFAKKMFNLYKNKKVSREDMIKAMFKFNCLLIDNEKDPDNYRVITSKDDICSYLENSVGLFDKSLVDDYKLARIKEA